MDNSDLEPRKPSTRHEIGCELDPLSVEELEMRIEMMRQEIKRLEHEIKNKKVSRDSANAVFNI